MQGYGHRSRNVWSPAATAHSCGELFRALLAVAVARGRSTERQRGESRLDAVPEKGQAWLRQRGKSSLVLVELNPDAAGMRRTEIQPLAAIALLNSINNFGQYFQLIF